MNRWIGFLLLIIPLLLTPACSKLNGQDVTTPDNSGNSGERTPLDEDSTGDGEENRADSSGDPEKTKADSDEEHGDIQNPAMMDYFLPDGSKVHYKGLGNEYAEIDMQVFHPYEDIVMTYEDNGGSLIRKLFKVEEDKIIKLDEEHVDTESNAPSIAEIKQMERQGIYLQKPFEKGASFEHWTVVDTDASVDTPYQKFDHAIVIEEKGNDYVNRRYFVEGFGEVKRESVMKGENDEEFTITSIMESVKQPH
ncbi:hypothetical protein [Sporosarcina trichiuri]|uniref:hypothetical protein n=1 Tax=Sporosarcina trichiuri TaxID=3056445 RepID=UPI0025B49C3A|nr:hypothetical protein [Sporosarcina sp. 0.2-SM1T-5]WJY28253.1 hypothetical protein QWT68_04510 [Sporosarcina sp. 0.2-SM1T-5]